MYEIYTFYEKNFWLVTVFRYVCIMCILCYKIESLESYVTEKARGIFKLSFGNHYLKGIM